MSKPVFSDLFTFSGRRNRKSFFLYSLAAWAALLLTVFTAGLIREYVGLAAVRIAVLLVALILFIIISVSHAAVTAQRCRDFAVTGWLVLLEVLPMVGWIFSLWVMFVPGTLGPNRYGPDPLAPALPAD